MIWGEVTLTVLELLNHGCRVSIGDEGGEPCKCPQEWTRWCRQGSRPSGSEAAGRSDQVSEVFGLFFHHDEKSCLFHTHRTNIVVTVVHSVMWLISCTLDSLIRL